MPCERYEPHLVAYVDGELDATLYDELSAHLKVCRECREAVRNVRISSAILRKWQTARPATSLVESVRRRIETEGAVPGTDADVVEITTRMAGRRRAPVIGRRRHVLAIAAVALLAVGLTLVFWHSTPPGLDRTPEQRLNALVGVAQWMTDPGQTPRLAAAFDDIVGEQLLRQDPDPDTVIQMEVVSSMIAQTRQARQRSDVIRIMQIMGEDGRLACTRRRLDRLAWGTGECLKALFSMSSACADDELDVLARRELDQARELESDGKLDEALVKYRKVAANRKLKVHALIQQATIHMTLGEADVALEKLESADLLARDRSFQKELIGELRLRAQKALDLEQKISRLQRELLRAQDEFQKLTEIGTLQVKAGNMKKAVQTWDDVARGANGKRSLHARLMKGWCLRRMNQKGKAADVFEALARDAAETNPDFALLARFEWAKTQQLDNKEGEGLIGYEELADSHRLSALAEAAVRFQIGYIQLYGEGGKTPTQQDKEKVRKTFETLKDEPYRSTPFGRLAEKVLNEM